MQRMVEAMIRSLRGIMAISWLLVIVMYVFSVMGTMLFRDGGDLASFTLVVSACPCFPCSKS